MYVKDVSASRSSRRIGVGFYPQWSPTSDEIAFAWEGNLWVCRADGSGRHRLLDRLSIPPAPTDQSQCMRSVTRNAWSSDGRNIAFVLSGCADEAIAVVQRDGGRGRKLLEGLGRVRSLTWSPGENTLAFVETVSADGKPRGDVVKLFNEAKADVRAVAISGAELGSVSALAFTPSGKLIGVTQKLAGSVWEHAFWELLPDGSYRTFLDASRLAGVGLLLRGGTIDPFAFAPKAPRMLLGAFLGHGESDLWVVDLPRDLVGLAPRSAPPRVSSQNRTAGPAQPGNKH